MFENIMENCPDWENEESLRDYLNDILDKKVFDHAGLIYGMGHAVYTLSDPREVILKRYAKFLAEEKGKTREFALYEKVEEIAGELIMHKRKLFKPVCAVHPDLCDLPYGRMVRTPSGGTGQRR